MVLMNNPIYEPKTRAKEYGDYALNIYTGCPHRCTYCYVPAVLHKTPEEFHSRVDPRPGILEATQKQLAKGDFKGKMIHLCFTCDPYPVGFDNSITREIIMSIKNAGAHVQILTKGGKQAERDFDLLDSGDLFGITLSCWWNEAWKEFEPNASNPVERINTLTEAYRRNFNTWISFEPVMKPDEVLHILKHTLADIGYKKMTCKIGKLNYVKNSTDWRSFGSEAERICKDNGWNYYIKEDLRKAMEAQ
jgi:DNA repair photolyase